MKEASLDFPLPFGFLVQEPSLRLRNMGVSENWGYLILGSLGSGSYYLGYYVRVPYLRNSHIASRTGLLEPLAGFPEGLAGAASRTTGSSSAARHHMPRSIWVSGLGLV